MAPPLRQSELLCERCGYPLRGVAPAGACPECGLRVDASHPRHRTGPPWHQRMSADAWARTWWGVIARPGPMFGHMTLAGTNWPARLFLLSIACGVGLGWGVGAAALTALPGPLAWGAGMLGVNVVLAMSYIEVLGVAWFSHRRGWRVPLGLAERVVCYAGAGWVIAGGLMGVFTWALGSGLVRGLWLGHVGPWTPGLSAGFAAVAFALAVLPFEWRVWRGVRQVKYANGGGIRSQ